MIEAGSLKSEEITEKMISDHLMTKNFGPYQDPDLLIRTSGEQRISNFLLWKLAYAELLFLPEHWPDLVRSEKLWQYTLDEYAKRNRRFGGGKKANYSGKKK